MVLSMLLFDNVYISHCVVSGSGCNSQVRYESCLSPFGVTAVLVQASNTETFLCTNVVLM